MTDEENSWDSDDEGMCVYVVCHVCMRVYVCEFVLVLCVYVRERVRENTARHVYVGI